MRNCLIPFKYALIILALYQLYSIFRNWGHDDYKAVISVIIFIGCILLALVVRIFNKDVQNSNSNG